MEKSREKKLIQAINLIEELSWLLDKNNLKLKEIPEILRNSLNDNYSNSISRKYSSSNPNKNFLIGVLPNLFQDTDLFKTNNDLIEFATTVLKVSISRSEKRSRYELIGFIVCEVRNLNDSDLEILVDALSNLTANEANLIRFKENKKKSNFSWNEAITYLSNFS